MSHTHTSGKEQSDPVGRSLVSMKRSQESEPALISVIFSFPLCLSKFKYHWLKNRRSEKTVNILYLMTGGKTPMELVINCTFL